MIFIGINDIQFSSRFFLGIIFLLSLCFSDAYAQVPITTDSRIRVLVYNPNEVYDLKFYYNYQSFIEFAEDEEIETISTGEAFAWRITPSGKRLFIRPLEVAAHTNMTIITNKRTYNFDIRSGEFTGKGDENLIYTLKFYYPQTDQPMPIPAQLVRSSPAFIRAAEQKNSRKLRDIQQRSFVADAPSPLQSQGAILVSPLPAISSEKSNLRANQDTAKLNLDIAPKKPGSIIIKEDNAAAPSLPIKSSIEAIPHKEEPAKFQDGKMNNPLIPALDIAGSDALKNVPKKNFAYKMSKDLDSIKLRKVFDDGVQTYFEFAGNSFFPKISAVDEKGREIPLIAKGKEGYLVVQNIERQFTIRMDAKMICVYNAAFGKKR